MNFEIASVWYSDDEFLFNTPKFPYVHNVQYHSQRYHYYVIYYIEDKRVADNINEYTSKHNLDGDKITFLNFKNVYPQYVANLRFLKLKSNKIDFMKMCVMDNSESLTDSPLLLMDFDCSVEGYVKQLTDSRPVYDIYVDDKVNLLWQPFNRRSFNSYVENYAVFIRTKTSSNSDYINVFGESSNSFMYAQFLSKVIRDYHTFGIECTSLRAHFKHTPEIKVSYMRGGSWRLSASDRSMAEYDYHYDPSAKPDFNAVCLVALLYSQILSAEWCVSSSDCKYEDVKKTLHKLYRLNYNFHNKFNWSNSLQAYTNVFGVICDRLDVEEFTCESWSYLKPLVIYDDDDDDDGRNSLDRYSRNSDVDDDYNDYGRFDENCNYSLQSKCSFLFDYMCGCASMRVALAWIKRIVSRVRSTLMNLIPVVTDVVL